MCCCFAANVCHLGDSRRRYCRCCCTNGGAHNTISVPHKHGGHTSPKPNTLGHESTVVCHLHVTQTDTSNTHPPLHNNGNVQRNNKNGNKPLGKRSRKEQTSCMTGQRSSGTWLNDATEWHTTSSEMWVDPNARHDCVGLHGLSQLHLW